MPSHSAAPAVVPMASIVSIHRRDQFGHDARWWILFSCCHLGLSRWAEGRAVTPVELWLPSIGWEVCNRPYELFNGQGHNRGITCQDFLHTAEKMNIWILYVKIKCWFSCYNIILFFCLYFTTVFESVENLISSSYNIEHFTKSPFILICSIFLHIQEIMSNTGIN